MIDSGTLGGTAVTLLISFKMKCFVQEKPIPDCHLQWMLNSASFDFNLFLIYFLNIPLQVLQVQSNSRSPRSGNLCQFGLNTYIQQIL